MTAPGDPPPDPPPRRPFEHLRGIEPEPFHRSQEFQRILWFGGLVVFLGLFALYALRSSPQADVPAEPKGEAPPATREELAGRRMRLFGLFEGSLSDSENGQDLSETAGYRRLLSLIAAYSPEEVRAKAVRTLDHAEALREPDLWRGDFVRARGLMSWMGAVKLQRPALGIRDVWRGALTEADATEGVIIDLVNPPPQFEMRREAVDVEGLFYRTVRYENARGEIKEAPYLIVRNFRVVDTSASHPTSFLRDHTGATLIGLAVAFGLTRLLMYWFQRKNRMRRTPRTQRTATDFHALFEKHRQSEDRHTGPRPPA